MTTMNFFLPGKRNKHFMVFHAMRAVLFVQEMFPELPETMLLGDLALVIAEKFQCSRATSYRYANSAIEALQGIPYKFTAARRAEAVKRTHAAQNCGRRKGSKHR